MPKKDTKIEEMIAGWIIETEQEINRLHRQQRILNNIQTVVHIMIGVTITLWASIMYLYVTSM